MVDDKFSIAMAVVWVIRCVLRCQFCREQFMLFRSDGSHFFSVSSRWGWFCNVFSLWRHFIEYTRWNNMMMIRWISSTCCKLKDQQTSEWNKKNFAHLVRSNWFAFEFLILEFSTSTDNRDSMRGLSVIREVLWKNQRRGHKHHRRNFFRESFYLVDWTR